MKKLLLAVVCIMFAATSFAQNALVASLNSGNNITYYYGVNALTEAVTAAKSGDIICLSGGSFNASDITKGITIRGAGIDSQEPTYLVNNFDINIPKEDANRFMMEGIRCTDNIGINGTFANPLFLKCQFNGVGNYDSETVTNIMFCNCKITGSFSPRGYNSYIMVNCFINYTTQSESATITATNCLFAEPSGYHISSYKQFQFFNCIFISINGKGGYNDATGNTNFIPANSQAQNCISVNFPEGYDAFKPLSVRSGCPVSSKGYTDVFKTYKGVYSDTEKFELTDAFINEFKGTDNKQIGLYGGLQPYDSTPSYPLITKMVVDEKTNASGQLGVTIEVK